MYLKEKVLKAIEVTHNLAHFCISANMGIAKEGARRCASPPQYLAYWHIGRTSIVLVNVLLLIKLKESSICRQIGLRTKSVFSEIGVV